MVILAPVGAKETVTTTTRRAGTLFQYSVLPIVSADVDWRYALPRMAALDSSLLGFLYWLACSLIPRDERGNGGTNAFASADAGAWTRRCESEHLSALARQLTPSARSGVLPGPFERALPLS